MLIFCLGPRRATIPVCYKLARLAIILDLGWGQSWGVSANLGSIEATVQSWGNLLRKLSITSLSLPVSIGRSFVDGMRLVSKVVPCIECLHV